MSAGPAGRLMQPYIRDLIEAALDQPNPTKALVSALNRTLLMTRNRARLVTPMPPVERAAAK